MNCPVCKRSLAPTLSICPTCGAMMNDTVREEVQKNLMTGSAVFTESRAVRPSTVNAIARPAIAVRPQVEHKRIHTNGLPPQKTSPTLVEFQNKNRSVPDWRLQLQNAVQQRKGNKSAHNDPQPLAATIPSRVRESAEIVAAENPDSIADPRVANAMRRIAESRKTFEEADAPPKRGVGQSAAPRPFGVVPVSKGVVPAVERAPIPTSPKPTLVNVPAPPAFKRDTNKLPRIEIGTPVNELENTSAAPPEVPQLLLDEPLEIKRIRITVEKNEADNAEWPVEEVDDIEDLAPFSMRFGAGLFDLIIGSFASMIMLSPLAFAGMEWMSWAGLLTFTSTAAVVLFLYMTASLGFFGKTAGMKLFSLELVDAVENEYPTLRQSAISSSIFLISLAFAGAGFLTIFFNEEKRAIHDLLSRTILVREF